MASKGDNDVMQDEIMKKLENASKDEAKNIIIDLIIPECRGVAKNFFDCVEEKTQNIDFKNAKSYEEVEKDLNEKFIPGCMETYNLEGCLQLNEKK